MSQSQVSAPSRADQRSSLEQSLQEMLQRGKSHCHFFVASLRTPHLHPPATPRTPAIPRYKSNTYTLHTPLKLEPAENVIVTSPVSKEFIRPETPILMTRQHCLLLQDPFIANPELGKSTVSSMHAADANVPIFAVDQQRQSSNEWMEACQYHGCAVDAGHLPQHLGDALAVTGNSCA